MARLLYVISGLYRYNDGSLTTPSQESAKVLADFFETTFTDEDINTLPSFSKRLGHVYLSDVHISEEIILHKLCNLKPYKSPGPDSLHAYILKEYADCLAKPLYMLYKQSLTAGHIGQMTGNVLILLRYLRKVVNLSHLTTDQ